MDQINKNKGPQCLKSEVTEALATSQELTGKVVINFNLDLLSADHREVLESFD